jgi:choloylglycine hydrolase
MQSFLRSSALLLSLGSATLSGLAAPASACTGIRLIAEDGSVIHARTLEFGLDLESTSSRAAMPGPALRPTARRG